MEQEIASDLVSCKVEYPETDGNTDHSKLENFNTSNNNSSTIVVVVIGWSACSHKNLKKYSDIYLTRGCIIVRCVTHFKTMVTHTQMLPTVAKKILGVMAQENLIQNPIFFHCFSNGGAYTYSYVLREIQIQGLTLNLMGTIHDSNPSPMNLAKYFRATLSGGAEKNPVIAYIIAIVITFALGLRIFWCHLKEATKVCWNGESLSPLRRIPHDEKGVEMNHFPISNWLGRICKMRNHFCLFLYCDSDSLHFQDEAEDVINIIESHGNNVDKNMFEGSEHVQHYRKYPEEYVKAVSNFVERVMKTKTKPTILYEG